MVKGGAMKDFMSASMDWLRATGCYGRRSHGELLFALVPVLVGLVIGIGHYIDLWTLGPNGFSAIYHRPPYWDFSNLWAGGKLAASGHVKALFDMQVYRPALRALFGPMLADQEWSYPPSALLIGAPLSHVPIFWAYVIWTLGALVGLYLALKSLKLPLAVNLAILTSPAVFISVIFGLNGALTAALMIGALALSSSRPVFAGMLAGLLTVKPHLGILIPFAFLASGNWRSIIAAGLTALAMVLLTGLLFGFDVWPLFLAKTGPLMANIMEAPFPQTYHGNALTFFIFGRSLGMPVTAAYVFQALFSLLSIAAVLWLWRGRSKVTLPNRVVLTALLSICATPYGYNYDTAPFALAVAWFFLHGRGPRIYLFALLWICSYFAHLPNYYGYGFGVLVPAGLAIYGLWSSLASARGKGVTAGAVTLSRSDDSRPSAG